MDLLLMERQAHLRALEDASSDEDIKAHLLIAKWLRGLVEFSLPELLEKAQFTLEGADKKSDTDYPDGGTEYMVRASKMESRSNELESSTQDAHTDETGP